MDKKEYLHAVMDCKIDADRVKKLEEKYKVVTNNVLARVISFAGTVDFFDEERRALEFDEIVDPTEFLGKDYLEKGIIPVIDAYDCTYIVYAIEQKKWAKYNTVDEILFKERDKIEDVI